MIRNRFVDDVVTLLGMDDYPNVLRIKTRINRVIAQEGIDVEWDGAGRVVQLIEGAGLADKWRTEHNNRTEKVGILEYHKLQKRVDYLEELVADLRYVVKSFGSELRASMVPCPFCEMINAHTQDCLYTKVTQRNE